jgi:hypothetical protein
MPPDLRAGLTTWLEDWGLFSTLDALLPDTFLLTGNMPVELAYA